MGKVFNNIDKQAYPAEAAHNLNGWERTMAYDSTRIPRITDTVGAGVALAKMGTSIPTPFARIFLFKTAFEMVNEAGANDQSAYGKLVSECLDLIEFILNYGGQIEFKPWHVANNINALKASPSEGHKFLGGSLEKFARDLNVQNIYLIYYNGVLIGGTSPFTLVYTSPNWQRIKNITNAAGLAGNPLFPDYSDPNVPAVPLHERHETFQLMLTRYYVAFRNVNNLHNTAFFTYLFNNLNVYSSSMMQEFNCMMQQAFNLSQLSGQYDYVRDTNGAELDIFGLGGANCLFLLKTAAPNGPNPQDNTVEKDYELVAPSNRSGLPQLPLALNNSGISAALYVAGNPLSPEVAKTITSDPTQPLEDRVLPGGMNIQYPYITEADFLQEKIVRTPFCINGEAFETFGISAAKGGYLLPLTQCFFKFFSPSDFGKVKNLSLSLTETDGGNKVEVILTVPVKCAARPSIELKHVYQAEDIINLTGYPDVFTLAVMPSYKIVSGTVPNIYNVMLHNQSGTLQTAFYALEANSIRELQDIATEKRSDILSTSYAEVKEAFDFIETTINGAKALVIPKFKQVALHGAAGAAVNNVVGIDFGTSNTYISISSNAGANPETLEITKDDMQVLTLNEIDLSQGDYGQKYTDSMFMINMFPTALDREFSPLLLGKQSDVAYPFRTVTCEKTGNQGFTTKPNTQLFSDINIGFNFMKEMFQLTDCEYNTNIKWDIENNSNTEPITVKQNRIKAFCEQTAWIIKNKMMLLRNPQGVFNVYITFPFTMSRTTKNTIAGYWKDAFAKYVGNGNVNIIRVSESVAPYYSLISRDGAIGANALNIDIGGGTTDMLFADVRNQKFYYSSSLFAANDIWGDGKHQVQHQRKDNGFVQDFENKLGHTLLVDQVYQDGYQQYKNIVKKSEDLMGYIFRYDDKFNYVSTVRNSKDKLMPVLCTHLGAILYHVAQVLKAKQMDIPQTITFSGMGSSYIRIISSEPEDIKYIVKALLAHFLGFGIKDPEKKMPSNFKVMFQANAKEVTAQGAMLTDYPSLLHIKQGFDEEAIFVYGVPTDKFEITYEESARYAKPVLEEYGRFLDAFVRNGDVIRFFKTEFDIRFNEQLANILEEKAADSFSLMTKEKDGQDTVMETMFFWPLKNGLYEASK